MRPIAVPPSILSTFVGTYAVGTGARGTLPFGAGTFVVTLAGDQLMLQRPGGKVRAPLVPVGDSRFVFIGAGAEVEFAKDAQGKVTQITLTAVEGQVRGIRREQ